MASNDMVQASDGLIAVARSGLVAADQASVRFDDAAWDTLLSSVPRHKLEGLLVQAIATGMISATNGQRRMAAELHRASMNWVLVLDSTLALIAREFVAAEVDFRLLKGASLAHALYPDPAMRPYVDIDLLVRGDQFAEAGRVIEAFGRDRRGVELRPGFDQHFGKGATYSRNGQPSIDLHRTFVAGPFAMTIDADSLFDRYGMIEIGGVQIQTLAPEEQFIHACFSAVACDHRPKLMALRDVVESSRDARLEPQRVTSIARAWRAEAVVARALEVAWGELDLVGGPRPELLQIEPIPQRSSHLLAAYESESQRWRRQAIAAIPLVVGRRARWNYLRAIAMARFN